MKHYRRYQKRGKVAKTFLKLAAIVLVVLVVLAFVGVQPLSAYKDNVIGWVKQTISSIGTGYPFTAEITQAKFDMATPSLANMLDARVRLRAPSQGLPIVVSVTPKEGFTGEPFLTRTVGGTEIIQSQPAIWILLFAKDGYLFGETGPITWTPNELQVPSTTIRDYYYSQALIEQRTKTVTFWVPGSDKVVVALKADIEEYFTGLQEDSVRSFINGDWLSDSTSVLSDK